MAIIRNIDEIRALIPTFKDLVRCGNFASVEDEIVESKPLYAFYVGGNFERTMHAKFMLIGLTNLYVLLLTNKANEIGRYCDFMAIPRDLTKPINPEYWKWNEDAIGLSFKSDNVSESIIYFGTERSDGDEIRSLFNKGLRKEVVPYKKLDRVSRNIVIDMLKSGKPSTFVSTTEKRNAEAKERLLKKETNIQSPSSALQPIKQTQLCLSPPSEVSESREVMKMNMVDYAAVLERYARMKYGKEEEHPSQNKSEAIITTEIVYV